MGSRAAIQERLPGARECERGWERSIEESKDYACPQREAAFFFGLFLRGHSADRLRQDIDVPEEVLAKWLRSREHAEPGFRETARRVYEFRKQVLAIFNFLVSSESHNTHKM